jgi:hypothetical protein
MYIMCSGERFPQKWYCGRLLRDDHRTRLAGVIAVMILVSMNILIGLV